MSILSDAIAAILSDDTLSTPRVKTTPRVPVSVIVRSPVIKTTVVRSGDVPSIEDPYGLEK
jgi:hypothetical protein